MKLKNADFATRAKIREANRRLPCLSRNNSNEPKQQPAAWGRRQDDEGKFNEFSTAHRKSAYALQLNVEAFINRFGLERVGFLTLTFADDVKDPKEAQRRFNSLRTAFLSKQYRHYIRVVERTKSGRIHYHLLVATKEDIRRGLNFRQISARNYSSANSAIRQHWERLREAMPRYGFGRSELLPVKTNSKGLARYISKYISKHIHSRISADKGVRLCQTSRDKEQSWKVANCGFQFLSEGSRQWRAKLAKWVSWVDGYFLRMNHLKGKEHIPITEENFLTRLKQELGCKWAFANRETIAAMPI